jgi:hypothetical protein
MQAQTQEGSKKVLFDWGGTLCSGKRLRPGALELITDLANQDVELTLVTLSNDPHILKPWKDQFPVIEQAFDNRVMCEMNEYTRAKEAVALGIPIVDDYDLRKLIRYVSDLTGLDRLYVDPNSLSTDPQSDTWAERVKQQILAFYSA